MSEFAEYPKWLHLKSGSVLVEDAEDEAAQIAWGEPNKLADPKVATEAAPTPAAPQRYQWNTSADDGLHLMEPNDVGEWVKWSDVAGLFAPPSNVVNLLVGKQSEPKKGGWPKGKPRNKPSNSAA